MLPNKSAEEATWNSWECNGDALPSDVGRVCCPARITMFFTESRRTHLPLRERALAMQLRVCIEIMLERHVSHPPS